jgi:CO/xanthine dehydrogenase Mo-binding subunit
VALSVNQDGNRTIGKSKPRYAGLGHVTGETRYVDDVFIPGTLVVKALRSPIHKGIIRKLETGRAENLPGVHGISTAADVPCNTYGCLTLDPPVLAEKHIRYKGEPLAAVAADKVEIADLPITPEKVLGALEAKERAPKR